MLKVAILGTGYIASIMANAMVKYCREYKISAICSRSLQQAERFKSELGLSDVQLFDDYQQLLKKGDFKLLYITSPTLTRHALCSQAIERGKHVLCEKPYLSSLEYEDLINLSVEYKTYLFDATHFVHNPRMMALKEQIKDGRFGELLSVYSTFSAPINDVENVRFNPTLEPLGALGDLAWYCLRAAIYLGNDTNSIKSACFHRRIHPNTKSIVGGSGFVVFDSNLSFNFNYGYDIGALKQQLQCLTSQAEVYIDDFVLPWHKSSVFDNPSQGHHISIRRGFEACEADEVMEYENEVPQHAKMLLNIESILNGGATSFYQTMLSETLATIELLEKSVTI